MYKAFIEPDLQTAHIKIINKFNPFMGLQNPTYILKVWHLTYLFVILRQVCWLLLRFTLFWRWSLLVIFKFEIPYHVYAAVIVIEECSGRSNQGCHV